MDNEGRTIGELARAANVHVETVRYYERRGLLDQPRRIGGWRRYGDEALRKLRFVRRAQELGFSLDEIAELFSLRTSSSMRTCSRVRAKAQSKLIEIDRKLEDLKAIRKTLQELTAICPTEGPGASCPILAAMDPVAQS